MHLETVLTISNDQKARVAQIFCTAFESKFEKVFGPKESGLPIVLKYLRSDRIAVAIHNGVVVGFAGLSFNGKGFLDISLQQLFCALRLRIFRLIFEGCGYVIFRQIWTFLSQPKGNEILLEALAVTERMRGKGIGHSLLDFIMAFGRSNGYTQIRLSVADVNPRARRLYERAGFKEVRVRRIVFPWNRILGFNETSEMINPLPITPQGIVD